MMSLRVIAGSAKGKRLKPVPGDSTRPIMDRVKEALFSILGPHINGSQFLDLYAGTGSVGIEALSRGAGFALFNELDRKALQTIRSNLKITSLEERSQVLGMDALSLLKKRPERDYDYIYIAPPQYKGLWLETLKVLDNNPQWVTDDTVVIVQIDPSEDETVFFENIEEYDRRIYGKTMLIFYERLGSGSN
ncbi:MAG: 16S rRNA (guanine(966)-N(2))-methyltransferase RsmD [Anaerolineaceae bacterium]|nr:16S rRNA (guanine(966)-N(2))-methyltransferase RsmD [Anaerolineaceae bacterium]